MKKQPWDTKTVVVTGGRLKGKIGFQYCDHHSDNGRLIVHFSDDSYYIKKEHIVEVKNLPANWLKEKIFTHCLDSVYPLQ
jgi:hypothetical protein